MNLTFGIPKGHVGRPWVLGLLLWVAAVGVASAQQPTVIRVNAGGGAYTDSTGAVWSADSGFSNGISTRTAVTDIAATPDQELYRTYRWVPPDQSSSLLYSANVPNGQYVIRLHFAETYGPTSVRGGRVFDVLVEGALAIDNLDIFDAVGANTAYVRTVTARVTDGQLNIAFRREVENPLVRAIEIRGVPSLLNTRYNIRDLGLPSGFSSVTGVDLNDSGVVAATGSGISPGSRRNELLRHRGGGGSWETAPIRNRTSTFYQDQGITAAALNSSGTVVGNWFVRCDLGGCPSSSTGILWSNGVQEISGGIVGINDSGSVFGNPDSLYSRRVGFLISGNDRREFCLWPTSSGCGGSSNARAINSSGAVVGSAQLSNGQTHAFQWTGTQIRDLGTLGGQSSEGVAINEAGWVAGLAQDASGRQRLTLWDGIATRNLGWFNDYGYSSLMQITDLNESGWITALGYMYAEGANRAFVWNATNSLLVELRHLDTPNGYFSTYARDLDEAGWVAGTSGGRAFLWSSDSGTLDLNTLIRSSDPLRPFVTLTEAVKINARGQILVNGTDNATGLQRAYILTPVDGTAPEITPTVSGTQGGGGWYRGNVTVSWTVSDPDSPITSTSGCGSTTVTFDTSGATYTCTATSEGGTTSRSVTVRRDSTPPSASAAPLTSPNGAGWYAGAVAVRFTGSDSLSGIASCSSDVTVSLEGSSVSSPGGTCTDVAGNVSAAVSATGLRIDRTAPSVSALRFPFANASGWINEAVTVSFTGSDALSGIAGCSGPVVLSLDGANQSAGGSCTDRAGNMGSTLLTGISIDRTAPTATTVLASAPNAAGWYREAVTVSFAGTDSMSGSGLAGCSAPVTVSTEGRNQTATGTCLDRAGNTSLGAVATVNVDRTSPTINVVSPQDGTSVRQGERLVAEYGCADGLSGVFACGGTVPSGTVLATDTAGTYTLTINATDAAGNTSARTVRFTVLAAEEPGGAPGRLELDPLGSNYAREPLGTVAPSGLDAASFTAEAWVQVGLPQLQETDASGVNRGTMALMSDGAYDLRVLYDASSGTPLKVIGRVWYLDGSGTLTPRVLESTAEAERIVLNAWTHVSVGYEASSNTCFKSVNGQVTVYAQCLPAGRTPAREYDQLFGIGTTDAGSGTGMCAAQLGSDPQRRNALNGSVDEVRISRVARYRAGFTPQGRLPLDADTLGLWRFDGAAGTTTFVNSVAGAVPLSGVASGARLAALQPGGIGGG